MTTRTKHNAPSVQAKTVDDPSYISFINKHWAYDDIPEMSNVELEKQMVDILKKTIIGLEFWAHEMRKKYSPNQGGYSCTNGVEMITNHIGLFIHEKEQKIENAERLSSYSTEQLINELNKRNYG